MRLPILKTPILLNIVIIIISLFISFFGLLFGVAHLIEGRNPNIPNSEHLKGLAIVITLCVIGVIFLVLTIAAIRGIIYRVKQRRKL